MRRHASVVNGQIGGTANVSYSDVQGGFAGDGNINFNPAIAHTGCTREDLMPVATFPVIDAGNLDPAFNVCFPPSLGTPHNDMGAFGGPGACALVEP